MKAESAVATLIQNLIWRDGNQVNTLVNTIKDQNISFGLFSDLRKGMWFTLRGA